MSGPDTRRALDRTRTRVRTRAERGATRRARLAPPLHQRLTSPRGERGTRKESYMPVKHALLALLAERDLTGYELKLRFERVLGEFWQLNSGQVYSTLERLRRAGMVARRRPDGESESTDDVARAAFSLRPRGRHALEEWLAAPIARLRPVRDPLFVKLAFSRPEHVPAILRTFAQETRRYREAAETLRALVAREPMSHGGRVRWLVAEAARLTYEAQLGWLDCVQRTLVDASVSSRRSDPHPLRPVAERSEAVA